jgi:hypothetical protein
METLEYYFMEGKGLSKNSFMQTYVEINEPHCITTIAIFFYADGSKEAKYFDQPFTGPALSEIRLNCRPSNFNVYKEGRQLCWNHYTELLKRTDHATRFETRKAEYARRASQ